MVVLEEKETCKGGVSQPRLICWVLTAVVLSIEALNVHLGGPQYIACLREIERTQEEEQNNLANENCAATMLTPFLASL